MRGQAIGVVRAVPFEGRLGGWGQGEKNVDL